MQPAGAIALSAAAPVPVRRRRAIALPSEKGEQEVALKPHRNIVETTPDKARTIAGGLAQACGGARPPTASRCAMILFRERSSGYTRAGASGTFGAGLE